MCLVCGDVIVGGVLAVGAVAPFVVAKVREKFCGCREDPCKHDGEEKTNGEVSE